MAGLRCGGEAAQARPSLGSRAVPASRRRPRHRALALAAAGAAATVLAACGAGPREANTSTVDGLILNRNVVVGGGKDRPSGVRALNAEPSKTLDQLQANMHHQIFGDGDDTILLPYLNGLKPNEIPADEEAAKHTYPGDVAYPGDRVGWVVRDRSDPAAVPPAVVGLFPAPFTSRFTKKRRHLPARIQCADVQSAACQSTQDALIALKQHTATSNLQDVSSIDVIRIYVGAWPALRPAFKSRLENGLAVEDDALRNGYGAQITPDGKQITTAPPFGEAGTPQTFGPGTGLVYAFTDAIKAADEAATGAPIWVVTGTDDAGAARAARALTEDALAGRVAAVLPPG